MTVSAKRVTFGFVDNSNRIRKRRKSSIANMKNENKVEVFEPYNPETDVVLLDIERMDKIINSPRHKLPRGLSREEKRQHIINTARNIK